MPKNYNHFSLKILIPIINILPTNAGIKRFMNQIPNVVAMIPIVLALYNDNNSVLNLPLIPRSAIANVGTIARTRNKIVIIQKPCIHNICTFNTCNSNIYCKTKTMYRRKDKVSNLNNTFASKSSKTLMYGAYRENAGIFSIIFITHERRKKKSNNNMTAQNVVNNNILIQNIDKPITDDSDPAVARMNSKPPQPMTKVMIS